MPQQERTPSGDPRARAHDLLIFRGSAAVDEPTAPVLFAVRKQVRMHFGGRLPLRALSVALSVAAMLMGAVLAFTVSRAVSPTPERSAGLDTRLEARGLHPGNPILIRIFKWESELEVWMQNGDRFQLFATYPICLWSGQLGPKEREGDRQAPEGFYSVAAGQLRRSERHPRALNIGFPNAVDRTLGRTGSLILVHGGCSSIGCFAMTDAVMNEIYELAEQALAKGQAEIQVEIFPFRMGEAEMAKHTSSKWYEFWRNLQEGYDAFERTHLPPRVAACGGRYLIVDRPSLADHGDAVANAQCASGGPVVVASRSPAASRRMKRHTAGSRASVRGAGHHVRGHASSRLWLAHSARRLRTSGVAGQLHVR